ncbi:MAG: C4-dicarboxylate transporter DctA [Acidobacteria bacterium]|nr:C4-dicarboxylate transporter DctA [Acidobacteriota bacterium]
MRYPKVLGSLYVQVVIGIALGVLLGFAGFIKLIKMLIAPIIFTTVTVGIAQMGHMKDVGRIGVRALVYFEVVSTAALLIGLVVVNVLKPGIGLHIDPGQLDATSVAAYTSTAQHLGPVDFILGVIPTTIADAFARGEVLQVLLVSVLTGLAMLSLGERIRPLTSLVEQVSKVLFAMVAMIMRLAPIGAFGAMAFTIGKYGLGTLLSLGQLMAGVYLTCLLFVFVVLAGILRSCRFNIVDVLAYIKEEILVVLGTASSESVLPRIMAKLEDLGCAKPVVGLVVPTGYSFNLDGTSIYMTMAAVFVAQATGVNLSLRQELSILAILLLTSKGAAAVTGSGFITLAATLAAVPTIPIAGLALLLGVDRFMSEARAITNLIGNVVATIFISNWDNSLDRATAMRVLRREPAVTGAFRRAAGERHDGKVVEEVW